MATAAGASLARSAPELTANGREEDVITGGITTTVVVVAPALRPHERFGESG